MKYINFESKNNSCCSSSLVAYTHNQGFYQVLKLFKLWCNRHSQTAYGGLGREVHTPMKTQVFYQSSQIKEVTHSPFLFEQLRPLFISRS
ncbi:hypothetical protein FGO68_gene1079 [Halteria grandinella]|uniref:Uncharacterized protein n=1 Tax=Halteria grandinella TaxID=5974 RepID=A0A8J8T7M9_HALGN|nr:hypothetical protein FGO68_gene1079 [Halteria grandinella]